MATAGALPARTACGQAEQIVFSEISELLTLLRMELSKVTARGQTTIPKRIREAANLHEGDVLAYSIEGDHVAMRRVGPRVSGDEYLLGLSQALGEWASPEDEEAWREL